MPPGKRFLPGILVPALMFLCACGGGGGSSHGSSPPRTNIDLAVTNFSVTPSSADPEDPLTLSGTIQNLGTETANPVLGDKFHVRFNLSKDGTFELNEKGFLEMTVFDPIPAGGSLPFSCTPPAPDCVAPYGGGDTLSIFGNFCNSQDCIPPETGVVGVKVDSVNEINEIQEGNNFEFKSIEVVGTRVAATFTGCSFGLPGGPGDPGCDLQVSDPFATVTLHYPCSNCGSATDIVLPNELHRTVFVSLILRGCTDNSTPNGICNGSWTITGSTQKPGLPASTVQVPLVCQSFFGDGSIKACAWVVEIRDPNY